MVASSSRPLFRWMHLDSCKGHLYIGPLYCRKRVSNTWVQRASFEYSPRFYRWIRNCKIVAMATTLWGKTRHTGRQLEHTVSAFSEMYTLSVVKGLGGTPLLFSSSSRAGESIVYLKASNGTWRCPLSLTHSTLPPRCSRLKVCS